MTGRIIPVGNVIEVRQGDSFTIRLSLHKCNEAIDLTNAQIRMQVRDSDNSKVIFELFTVPIDAKNGKVALMLTPEQTNIPVGDYVTDIQLTTEDGSVNTIFPADVNKIATFRITEQVTHD